MEINKLSRRFEILCFSYLKSLIFLVLPVYTTRKYTDVKYKFYRHSVRYKQRKDLSLETPMQNSCGITSNILECPLFVSGKVDLKILCSPKFETNQIVPEGTKKLIIFNISKKTKTSEFPSKLLLELRNRVQV